MKAFVQSMIPRSIRQYLHNRYETNSLAALPGTACHVSNLRAETPDVSTLSAAEEWRSVQTEVEQSKLNNKAGAVNPGDQRAIYYLTRILKATSILEVGTHLGASTAMFATALRNSSVASPRIVTVDITDVNGPSGAWARLGSAQPAALMRTLRCDFIEFVTSPSIPFLRNCAERFDLIFLDGGHEAATVYQEVPLALKLLKPNGLILLHDFYPNAQPLWSDGAMIEGPWLATQRFVQEGCKIKVSPLGALPWPTKLGSNVTSLAVLTAA